MSKIKNLEIHHTLLAETGFSDGPESGLYQGNGDIYTSFWNGPREMTWSVGKNDVWDRRYYGDGKAIVTLEEIKTWAFDGKKAANGEELSGRKGSAAEQYYVYDFPCPKPVGQIILRAPDFADVPFERAELNMEDCTLRLNAEKDGKRIRVESYPSAIRNIMVIHADWEGLASGLRLDIYRHRDTVEYGKTVMRESGSYGPRDYDYSQDAGNGPMDPPESGTDGRCFWIRQRFPAEATFPDGFETVMMAMITGAGYEVELKSDTSDEGAKIPLKPLTKEEYSAIHGAWREKRYAIEKVNGARGWAACAAIDAGSRGQLTAFVSVMTTRDSADPFTAAKDQLLAAERDGQDIVRREHLQWWAEHWSRSSVTTEDRLAQSFIDTVYRLGWSSRQGKVPLNNIGQYCFTDATPWHGDFHFNEIWLWPFMQANHAQEVMPWFEMIEGLLPSARNNARDVYGLEGACFTMVNYPLKSRRPIYTNATWELGLEMTAMILKPFWQYFRYTGDRLFLRDRAYPMMREGARFYREYVTKGEDGFYHIVPTVSQENWGLTKDFRLNRDSVGALSQVKYHLRACAEAAELLNLDSAERAEWAEIADRMAPYPTYETEEGPVFVDVRDNTPHRGIELFQELTMVLWGDDIHIESDPALLEIARRTAKRQYFYEREMKIDAFSRLGFLRTIERRLGLPRSMDYYDLEDLVMSFTGRIHLFYGIDDARDVRFDRLLAFGGFEVSAAKTGGIVQDIRIKSLAGETCRLVNPWGDDPVRVVNSSGREIPGTKLVDRLIEFDTDIGETYGVVRR